jgi:hypothetical protein
VQACHLAGALQASRRPPGCPSPPWCTHTVPPGTCPVLPNPALYRLPSVLQMHLVRSITGKQFTDALDENLRPVLG